MRLLAPLRALSFLTQLSISGCIAVTDVSCLVSAGGGGMMLEQLDAGGCTALAALPSPLPLCRQIDAAGCIMLRALPAGCAKLEGLNIAGCTAVQSLAPLAAASETLQVKFLTSALASLFAIPTGGEERRRV